jgi:hypothetical protein
MKKNFNLSINAHSFAKKIREEKGNPQEYKEIAQLGMAIGFKDKEHQDLDKTTLKHNIADTEDILDEGSTHIIYEGLYPESSKEDLWLNIEKAASYGIELIEKKYYSKQDKLINWKKIINDFF